MFSSFNQTVVLFLSTIQELIHGLLPFARSFRKCGEEVERNTDRWIETREQEYQQSQKVEDLPT